MNRLFKYDTLAIFSIFVTIFIIFISPALIVFVDTYTTTDLFDTFYNPTANPALFFLRFLVGFIPLIFIILIFRRWMEINQRKQPILWIILFIWFNVFCALIIYYIKVRKLIRNPPNWRAPPGAGNG